MYKLIETTTLSGQEIRNIKRIADNAFIPFDQDNTDYKEYLKWLEEGNQPEPAEGTV
jgi:hypothetical protein